MHVKLECPNVKQLLSTKEPASVNTGMVCKMQLGTSTAASNGNVASVTKFSGQKHFWISTWTRTIKLKSIQ